MMENNPTLYLIPVPLGETEHSRVLPEYNRTIVRSLHHFIVENIRSARRFLKTADRSIDIDSLTFYELNKHTSAEEVSTYLHPMAAGESMGVISEAGCPAIADPGADGATRGAEFDPDGTDGFRLQWSELRFQRLPAHRRK